MSKGATGFYDVTQMLKDQLLSDVNINTVTIGDITDINLNKTDMFPIAHLITNNVVCQEQVLVFNVSIMSCDIVNKSKELTLDRYVDNNNMQDILNTHLLVLNKLIQRLRKGQLHQDGYQLEGDPSVSPFYDRFENQMAGWTADFNIIIHNDITIC